MVITFDILDTIAPPNFIYSIISHFNATNNRIKISKNNKYLKEQDKKMVYEYSLFLIKYGLVYTPF
jgi:hypothetical protein